MLDAALVDAFTQEPFKGNPAGLVLLDEQPRDPSWMQQVAAELGASETAFLDPGESGSYTLQWFTPAVEVELCGHATLAAAHWLWERGDEEGRSISFKTRSGVLSATRSLPGDLIWLDFPVVPIVDIRQPDNWREAFGDDGLSWVGRTAGVQDIHVNGLIVTDADTLRSVTPDFGQVANLPCGGVIVTAFSDLPDVDVLTRYFAPACGVNEDPVTGSAHCTVGWYWAGILGTQRLRARQVSSRGGNLQVQVDERRVGLGGHAVTTVEMRLHA